MVGGASSRRGGYGFGVEAGAISLIPGVMGWRMGLVHTGVWLGKADYSVMEHWLAVSASSNVFLSLDHDGDVAIIDTYCVGDVT